MRTSAVLVERPDRLSLAEVALLPPGAGDVVVDVGWTGVSTGTERLLVTGAMPFFPGLGYPLVPGYEAVGRIVEAGPESGRRAGEAVFVPGAQCFADARGLFGASAARLVVQAARAKPIDPGLGPDAVCLALAATARHAIAAPGALLPELIVGHGVLGRLIARLTVAAGAPAPTVWEREPARRSGATGYPVLDPDRDPRRDYRSIYDASGDPGLLDALIGRLARGGEIVLAGFYKEPLRFAFPPAFMRELRLRVSAEWQEDDLAEVRRLVDDGQLSLAGLVTHEASAADPEPAYRTAFDDPGCLKMILDWKGLP